MINWDDKEQAKEGLSLLQSWDKSKIGFDEALHLLSAFFCANETYTQRSVGKPKVMFEIRKYGTDIIKKVSEDKFAMILLQLV